MASSTPAPEPTRPAWKSWSAVPIHGLTISNIGFLIGLKLSKNRAYKELRATLVEQINNEAEREAAKYTEEDMPEFEPLEENPDAMVRQPNTPSQILIHVKFAPNAELVRIAQDIIQRRRAHEQMYGNYALAQELGPENNDRERKEVANYQRLIRKIKLFERWIPQLGTALLGTGTASLFTLLRQVGFVS